MDKRQLLGRDFRLGTFDVGHIISYIDLLLRDGPWGVAMQAVEHGIINA